MKYTTRDAMERMNTRVTRIFPMPVWAEISSPAQSLASLRKSSSGASSGFWP